ncbi:MAG TPA: hypothetical protein VK191_11455 [Symbiobacteriaceae bacterium]|nr:hypothetical protein [Symbiobacteriaceae bacterium]
MKGLGSDNEVTTSLPIEDLVEAYYQGHMVVWLCHLLRLSDRSDQIPDFLAMLDEYAESKYNLYLDVGRLMFRRIVDGVAQPTPESAQGADQITAQLRQKTKGAAQVKREVARQREAIAREKRWRKAKDRTLSAYLESIRQEVAAAEGELIATLHQNEAEVTALQAEHQAQLDHVAAEIARVEAAFAESVRAQTSALPLAGLRIALQGEWGAAEQLLIESAGGQIVAARPDLTLCLGAPGPDMPARFCTTAFGPVGLERLLHRKVLPQITQFRPT